MVEVLSRRALNRALLERQMLLMEFLAADADTQDTQLSVLRGTG